MSTLLVIRGNSGSGKSTAARTLQHALGAVWIEQDYFRRTVLGETGNYSPLSVELIEQSAALALRHGRIVIMDGMFNASLYSETFQRLRDGHAGASLFYAYDLSFEQTLLRHATRTDKVRDFGEHEMRRWYHGWNPLDGIVEQRIPPGETLEGTVARLLADARAVGCDDAG